MARYLSNVTLVVDDYDRAIDYYVNVLGFSLVEDVAISDGKRWVVVSPSLDKDTLNTCNILLAEASDTSQQSRIGNQTGDRVSFFLHSDRFDEDFIKFSNSGVDFIEKPRVEAYGKVVVFKDLFGNKWDLIELNR